MPGVVQHTRDSLRQAAADAVDAGVGGLMLFGVPRDEDKDATGSVGVAEDGILNVALRDLAKDLGDATVLMADTCLDEFTDHGHCGVLDASGRVDNDATNARYVELAVAQADSGAHVVGPSGMMDGQVAAIRDGLDAAGHTDVVILAYAAKFASAFYGPFREAVASSLQGDRRTYQQDPANAREALHEIELDIAEGADIVMVKPAMAYLDVVRGGGRHLAGAGGRLPGLGRVLDDQRRRRQRLDRRPGRRAGVADRHPARRCRHRAHLLGGRRRRLAGVSEETGRAGHEARPADVDTGFWLWVVALPLMVAGYLVDLVSAPSVRTRRLVVYVVLGHVRVRHRRGRRDVPDPDAAGLPMGAHRAHRRRGRLHGVRRHQPVHGRPADDGRGGALRGQRHRRLGADRRRECSCCTARTPTPSSFANGR